MYVQRTGRAWAEFASAYYFIRVSLFAFFAGILLESLFGVLARGDDDQSHRLRFAIHTAPLNSPRFVPDTSIYIAHYFITIIISMHVEHFFTTDLLYILDICSLASFHILFRDK